MRLLTAALVILVIVSSLPARAQRRAEPAIRTATVVSEPNAAVWIDGVRYGTTDPAGRLPVRAIPAGARTVRVRVDGKKEVSKIFPAAHKADLIVSVTAEADEAEKAFQEAEKAAGSDRKKAEESYLKAVRLRPKYPEAFVGLARIYTELGEIEKAEKAVRDARRLRPGYAEASAVEGRILKDAGDETKAIAAFKRAIAEGKGFQPEAYTGLGMLYKERAETAGSGGDYQTEEEQYTEAAKYFDTAVKQLGGSPDAAVVMQLLGLIYERQKKYKEAIALYENFLRIFPDTSESTAVRSFIEQIRKQMQPR